MTKAEFEKLKGNCPWFYRSMGEPKCMGQNTQQHYRRHCTKKNCAVVYWSQILKEVTNADD